MRYALLGGLAAALVSVPAFAKDKTRCHSRECVERVARHHCNQRHPRWCVTRAILTYRLYGWQAAWMHRIPHCESGWNPMAYFGNPSNRAYKTYYVFANDISAGLYEFKPSTFKGTPYGHPYVRIWYAKWSALAAAWMVRSGRSGEWVCA